MKIKYVVIHRDIKYPRLEFRPEALFVIVPKHIQDEKEILKRKENWIKRKYERIREISRVERDLLNKFLIFGQIYKIKKVLGIPKFRIDKKRKEIMINRKSTRSFQKHLKMLLKDKLLAIVNEYSKELNTKFNKIFVRTQKTKWASCSLKRNLSFNLKLVSLPENLIRYIIFHELLHLKERKHNYYFVNFLEQKFENYKELEKMLFRYWFIVNLNKFWRKILNQPNF